VWFAKNIFPDWSLNASHPGGSLEDMDAGWWCCGRRDPNKKFNNIRAMKQLDLQRNLLV
jgi:hypothetical protein